MEMTNVTLINEGAVFFFAGISADELGIKIKDMFVREGYSLEEGTFTNGAYGVGDATKRLLFGAFVKRFKFKVNMYEREGKTVFEFLKAMPTFSGGLIGIKQQKKETERIIELIKGLK